MKIAARLPMPKSMRNDSGIEINLVPIASNPNDAWYARANISPNHAEFCEDKGRRLPKSGLGLTRVQVCANQCGFSPATLFALAGVGKNSKEARRQRC